MTTELQNQTNAAIQYFDLEAAIKILGNLQKLGELDMSNPDILKLYYIRINSLSADQLYEVMKSSILVAYEIEDYKLSERFKEFLVQYNFVPDEIGLCEKIIKLLQTSEEVLGTEYISILGKDTAPYVNYWIKDHINSIGNRKRDALGLMQYLNTSPNVKTLSPRERVVLKDILELHDYCQDMVSMWDSLPDNIDDRDLEASQKAFDWTTLVLGLQDDFDPGLDIISKPKTEPTPAPVPTPVAKPQAPIPRPSANLPEFDAARPTPSPSISENKASVPEVEQPKPRMNVPNQYTSNPGKIHDLINKPKPKMGVVMDPTNVKLEEEKRRMVKDRDDQKDIIALKLQELRKRNQGDNQENK